MVFEKQLCDWFILRENFFYFIFLLGVVCVVPWGQQVITWTCMWFKMVQYSVISSQSDKDLLSLWLCWAHINRTWECFYSGKRCDLDAAKQLNIYCQQHTAHTHTPSVRMIAMIMLTDNVKISDQVSKLSVYQCFGIFLTLDYKSVRGRWYLRVCFVVLLHHVHIAAQSFFG